MPLTLCFWAKDGDKFHVIADYVTESRKEALKLARGVDETFCSQSREVNIDANGDGPIATALKTGKEVILRDSSKMKRAALAEEFGLASFRCVPTQSGGFSDASKEYVLDANGDGPVGTVMKTQQPFYLQDATACATMKRNPSLVKHWFSFLLVVPPLILPVAAGS